MRLPQHVASMVPSFFLSLNFTTGPGITLQVRSWLLVLVLITVLLYHFSSKSQLWMILDLFIMLFINWRLNGMFCIIKPDRLPFCSPNTVGVFWVTFFPICLFFFFFLALSITNGGAGSLEEWIVERILRDVRSRHITFISKVFHHQCQSIYLPLLSWSFLFLIASLHVDQVKRLFYPDVIIIFY